MVKPSEYTSASTLEFCKLVEEAGFPTGVVNVVTGFGADVGEPLVTHPKVAKVAFTGGELSGQKVYESAAKGLKRVTLELGGKSPNIVFDDAKLDDAVKGAISGIFAATGQTCIAGSRLLVQSSIHDEFVDKLVCVRQDGAHGRPDERRHAGRPDHDAAAVQEGPRLHRHRQGRGRAVRARRRPARSGPNAATAGSSSRRSSPASTTRCASRARKSSARSCRSSASDDEDEAIAIANDTLYGLAAGVWTQSIKRALKVSERLQAGTVWVNTYRAVSYMSPFGGYKRSGIGRENGQDAIWEYLQTKSVWISTGGRGAEPVRDAVEITLLPNGEKEGPAA